MTITVDMALQIYPLSTARVLAGHSGLHREIRVLNIMERPDVAEWMRGGELLFSSGFAIRDSTYQFVDIIPRLAERGVSALAIRPSDFLPTPTEEMINCANQVGLPLLQIDRNIPYMDYMEPLLARLVNEQLALLRTTEDVHTRLMSAMLHGGGVDSILQTLEGIIDTAVALIDGRRRLQNETPSLLHLNLERIYREHSLHFNTKTQNPGEYISVHIDGVGDFGCIVLNGNYAGRVVLLTREDFPIQREVSILAQENAASLLAVELTNRDVVSNQILAVRGEMLEELLERPNLPPDIRRQRAGFIGVDLEATYYVFVLRTAESTEATDRRSLNAYGDSLVNVRQYVIDSLNQGLQSTGTVFFLHYRGNEILGLLNPGRTAQEQLYKTLRSLVLRLRRSYPEICFSLGVSEATQGGQLLRRAYDRAALSASIGLRFMYGKPVVPYATLGVFRFLDAIEDKDALLDYIREQLGPLLDHKYAEDLTYTLRLFFANKQNISQTAQALFVHKNTVVYRLHKIEELLNMDLDDYERVFELQFCLKAYDLLNP